MNTPAHLLIGSAVLARRDDWRTAVAAIAGSFMPDFSLYFMVFWSRYAKGLSEAQIFGERYYSDFWQGIFAVDNSLPLWGALVLVSALLGRKTLLVFGLAGLLHILLDFPLHHDDGRAHFWPFSDWIYESPISYWDPRAHGGIVGPLEVAACVFAATVLWRRFEGWVARALVALGMLAELLPFVMFRFMFAGPVG